MAVRSNYDNVIIDTEGNALDNIQVTVKLAGTSTNATIYNSKTGSAKSNPFTTSSNGLASFWAEPGSYDIVFTDTQSPARVASRTLTWEAVSGADDGIDDDQIDSIAYSKLDNTDSGKILVANGSGVFSAVTMSGAATIDSSGVVTLTNPTTHSDTQSGIISASGVLTGISVTPGAGTYLAIATAALEESSDNVVVGGQISLRVGGSNVINGPICHFETAATGTDSQILVVHGIITPNGSQAVEVYGNIITGTPDISSGRLILIK